MHTHTLLGVGVAEGETTRIGAGEALEVVRSGAPVC
jgi:hypothetical protein